MWQNITMVVASYCQTIMGFSNYGGTIKVAII